MIVLLFACKKENDTAPPPSSTEKVAVEFNVSNFLTEVTPIDGKNGRKAAASSATNKDASLDGLTDLYYYVGNGTVIKSGHQTSDSPDFGTFRDSLLPGDYYVYVSAAPQPIPEHPVGAFPEIFYKGTTLVVTAETPDTISLVLARRVGLLELNITDAQPSDSIRVTCSYEYASFDEYRIMPMGYRTTPMPITARSTTQFSEFILTVSYLTITIEYLDRVSHTFKSKNLSAKVENNNKTTITGKLYPDAPDSPQSQFNIKVDRTWGDSPTNINF